MTTTVIARPRHHGLDYLRGLAAFGIMIYHFLTWWVAAFPAESFMGRVGLYGVAVFYVLSGLTLHLVYFEKMDGLRGVRDFGIKRVFRIFPLLWIVTFAAIVLSQTMPDLWDLFLNLSGLFGFVKWDAYLSTGVWSIGNELVFYVLFPMMVLLAKTRRSLFVLFGIALLAPYIYFAFFGLSTSASLGSQWSMYINPLNQAFLFFGGFAIGFALRARRVPAIAAIGVLGAAVLVFAFWPVSGETIGLVTGANRLVFTLVCFAVCAAVYQLPIDLPRLLHAPLARLGEASYSLYLIHPIVFGAMAFLPEGVLPVPVLIAIGIVVSLTASLLCYQYFEKYFMRLGRRVASG